MRQISKNRSGRVAVKGFAVVFLLVAALVAGSSSLGGFSSDSVVYAKGVTLGQRNALRTARNYLRTMPFSQKGLVKQLKYEGYSSKEARYGAGHCKANWKKQALKSAKNYLGTMAFSRKGLIKQLKYEGFTASQANYGVAHCGANWKKQAAKSAKNYLKTMSFSKSGLINQLMYEGFTRAQANYGVKKAGY